MISDKCKERKYKRERVVGNHFVSAATEGLRLSVRIFAKRYRYYYY